MQNSITLAMNLTDGFSIFLVMRAIEASDVKALDFPS